MKYFTLVLSLLACGRAIAAPMNTCEVQEQCIEIEANLYKTNKCSSVTCEYEVCLTVSGKGSNCPSTFSHSCEKPELMCDHKNKTKGLYEFPKFYDGEKFASENFNVKKGRKMCQIVGPGEKVQFLLKDGNGCKKTAGPVTTAVTTSSPNFMLPNQVASCAPRDSNTTSCTGNGVGIECVWEYTAPSCSTELIANPNGTKDTKSEHNSGARGDPHIQTFSGELYDFHGICDLVLLHNPGFENGLGMDIHIRTKKMHQWSYISSAAVKIGEDTFELKAENKKADYWVNGMIGDEALLSRNKILQMTVSGYPIKYRQLNSLQKEFIIDLGHGERIEFKTWKKMIRVEVVGPTPQNFGSSVGLMGTYEKSLKIGRDHKTILDDLNAFGQEWQVLESEPMLFHDIDGPQAPTRCEIPSNVQVRRRLAESTITLESAEIACASVSKEDFNLCVFDVMASNDKKIAGAY